MRKRHASNASPRCALVTADQHDLVGRRQRADAMDDERIEDVEAALRLGDDRLERLLRHARDSARA